MSKKNSNTVASMSNIVANDIMVGCDLHDRNMLLLMARGRCEPEKQSWQNSKASRQKMIEDLKKRSALAGGARIVFAYEASSLGFGLHDELKEAGIECFVLAPSRIVRSPKERLNKTDEKDAMRILEILRGHCLAGNKIPSVWIPPRQVRDDREIVRARLDVQEKATSVKTQIRTLLKRNGIEKQAEDELGSGWTKAFKDWVKALSECDEPLAVGARQNLASLLRQLEMFEGEVATLNKQVAALSHEARHAQSVKALTALNGVAVLSAMVFLTELGDPHRFLNRRKFGSFMGLVPTAHETGETDDRKGHITHQGPGRIRFILCQCAWNHIRTDAQERAIYETIVSKNPKHKKIALVAAMRRLGIKMWHNARAAAGVGKALAGKQLK